MALTLPANWKAAFDDENVTPVFLLRIEIGVRAHFTVVDYAQGALDWARITHTPSGGGATNYTVTEGTDFDAETDDETTAGNIAAAFRAVLPEGVLCYSRGTQVTVIAPDGDTIARATSDASAWSLTPGLDSGGTLSACSGDKPVLGYAPILGHVSKLGVEIDPVKRHLPRPEVLDLEVADNGAGDVLRLWMSRYPDLRGKTARLYLGWQEVTTLTDCVQVGVYRVHRALPNGTSPSIKLRLTETGWDLEHLELRPDVVLSHHLEAIAEIFEQADRASGYVSSGLDPSNYSDIGHWCVSRGQYLRDMTATSVQEKPENPGTWPEPKKASDLLNELLEVLDGSMAQQEDGRYAFSRQSFPASSADYALDEDEVADFRQVEHLPAYNEVRMSGPYDVGGTQQLIRLRNENSRDQHGAVGGPTTYSVLDVQSSWLGGIGTLGTTSSGGGVDASDGPGVVMYVDWCGANGFSGLRRDTAPTPGSAPPAFPYNQDSNTAASSARPVYLMLFDASRKIREIIRCESATMGLLGAAQISDAASGTWNRAGFTIAERGLFGTSARDWRVSTNSNQDNQYLPVGTTRVMDVTPAVQSCQRKLDRLADGAAVVEFSTTLRHYGMQLGETVEFTTERFLDFGQDGLTSSAGAVFELIRKEVTPNGIAWKAALLSYNRTTAYTPVPVTPNFPPPVFGLRNLYSVSFDGSSDYAQAAGVTTLDGATYAWWQGWVKLVSPADADVILSRFDSGNEQFEISIKNGSTAGYYEVRVDIGSGHYTVTTDEPLNADAWYHLAIFYDGSAGAVLIYVDGAKSATTTSGAVPGTLSSGGGSNLRFAGRSDAGSPTWAGLLDEWAMGASASAMDEDAWSTEWYNLGTPPHLQHSASAPAPDHWWRFENGWIEPVGGAHLTPYGAPYFTGDVP